MSDYWPEALDVLRAELAEERRVTDTLRQHGERQAQEIDGLRADREQARAEAAAAKRSHDVLFSSRSAAEERAVAAEARAEEVHRAAAARFSAAADDGDRREAELARALVKYLPDHRDAATADAWSHAAILAAVHELGARHRAAVRGELERGEQERADERTIARLRVEREGVIRALDGYTQAQAPERPAVARLVAGVLPDDSDPPLGELVAALGEALAKVRGEREEALAEAAELRADLDRLRDERTAERAQAREQRDALLGEWGKVIDVLLGWREDDEDRAMLIQIRDDPFGHDPPGGALAEIVGDALAEAEDVGGDLRADLDRVEGERANAAAALREARDELGRVASLLWAMLHSYAAHIPSDRRPAVPARPELWRLADYEAAIGALAKALADAREDAEIGRARAQISERNDECTIVRLRAELDTARRDLRELTAVARPLLDALRARLGDA